MNVQFFENGDRTRPTRSKQMGHLLDLLRSNGIQDQQSFRSWIGARTTIKHGDAEFQVVTAKDLRLDDENRLHSPEFKIREVIVDCDEVVIQNSSRIIILDCAFMGSLIIGNKTGCNIGVSLDTVIIGKELSIYANEYVISPASLTDVRSPALRLDNFHCDEIHVSGCAFASTHLTRLTGNVLSVWQSQLGALKITDDKFEAVRFPPGQVDFRSLNKPSKLLGLLRKRHEQFKPFDLPPQMPFDETLKKISRSEQVRHFSETLTFLQKHSEDRFSRRHAADLKYLRALAESPSHLSTALIVVTGALVKPARIVGLAAATIAIFAIAFLCGGQEFDGKPVESLLDALYFSGLTFTTIGYGDITPRGFARLLAVLEGLLGILLSSAFVVSCVRRHIE